MTAGVEVVGALDCRVVGQVFDVAISTGPDEGPFVGTWSARWLIYTGAEGCIWITASGVPRTIGRMGTVCEGSFVECIGVPRLMSEENGGGFYVAANAWRRVSPEKASRWDWLAVGIGNVIGRFLAIVDTAAASRRKRLNPAERQGWRQEVIR